MRKIEPHPAIPINTVIELTKAQPLGPSDVIITCLCPADEPQQGGLTFLGTSAGVDVLLSLQEAGVVAVFVSETCREAIVAADFNYSCAILFVADPFHAMMKSVPLFYYPLEPDSGISPQAVVHSSAKIGNDVSIDAFCYIGADAIIGDGVKIFPHVTIYPGAQIGHGSVIHAGAVIREECVVGPLSVIQNGAVIGADGFGYRPDPQLGLVAFPQVGITSLAARVDIGANACIDRGALGDTTIGTGTKIDNLVQVGHNTKIGAYSILCGLVGVSGSCRIGDQVTLAGGVGVADHVSIPSKTRFGARSGVTGSVREAGDYAGFPVVKASEWRRQAAALRGLPELVREMRSALKKIASIGS